MGEFYDTVSCNWARLFDMLRVGIALVDLLAFLVGCSSSHHTTGVAGGGETALSGSNATAGSRSGDPSAAVSGSGSGGTTTKSLGGGSASTDAELPDCGKETVKCVPNEYATIQAAANATNPGDLVLVAAGSYRGVDISRSGAANAFITYLAAGPATILNQGSEDYDDGIRLQNVDYIVIDGFSIDAISMTGRCIAARGATATEPMTGNVIRNVDCRGAAHEGFYLSQFGGGLVEHCTIVGSGRDGSPRGHGIYLANAGSDGTTLRGNRISDASPAESAGIHLNGDLSIGGDGLIQNVTIENNVITGNNHNGINADGLQHSVIRGNLITNNAMSGIRSYSIDGAAGPEGLSIVNNTLSGNANFGIKLTEDLGGHVVFNNIALGGVGSLCVGGSLQSDHNVFGGPLSYDEESSTITLVAWRAGTRQDASSLTGSANAVFLSTSDFHLSSSSPARNAGIASLAQVAAPTLDLDGTRRPSGANLDVGAYEFVE